LERSGRAIAAAAAQQNCLTLPFIEHKAASNPNNHNLATNNRAGQSTPCEALYAENRTLTVIRDAKCRLETINGFLPLLRDVESSLIGHVESPSRLVWASSSSKNAGTFVFDLWRKS
jgi:hypothetical protein